MSHALSLTQPTSVRRGRSAVIALWVVQIALAGMFLLAGGSKLLGAPAMVTLFNTIGVGQWFRYVTHMTEESPVAIVGATVLRTEFYKALPPDHQKKLMETSKKAHAALIENVRAAAFV